MFNVGTALATLVYLVSLFISIYWVSRTNSNQAGMRVYLFPILFMLVMALYVLPLSIRTIFTLEIVGNISPYLELFSPYIPFALLLCSVFTLVFALTFTSTSIDLRTAHGTGGPTILGRAELIAICALVGVCVFMLFLLGAKVGGISYLLLYGYRVTEVFADAGHLAVALDWLIVLCIVLVFSGFISRSKVQLVMAFVLAAVLVAALILMGRRGVVVVLSGSLLYAYHVCYRKLSFLKISVLGCILFVGLNLVGLLRGDTYDSFAGVIESIAARQSELNEDGPSLFYVLSSGNFAVPFETLPQVMRSMGEKYLPGFGLYSFQSLSLVVPSALWPDRPLPLANWYMENFYGPTPKNEGRQFFFLTEGYMNFGPVGALIWGVLVGYLMRKLVMMSRYSSTDPLIGALVALFVASFLNFVAMDTVGFVVVFLKQYGVPLFVLFAVRKSFGRTVL